MEDDELTRARRSLRGADPEIDLSRVYADSWARAHGAGTHEDWAPDEGVEIVLQGTGPDGRSVRRLVRRGPVLAWGAVAAAAAVALVVSVVNLPAPGTAPGSAPTTGGISATTDTGPTPGAEPTVGVTPAGVVDRAAVAVAAAARCGLMTRSTLGDESALGTYDSATAAGGATDTDTPTSTPTPDPLGERPEAVLQAEAVAAALGLSGLEGADYHLHPDVMLEQDDGATLARIRFTPPAELVPGGEVTRIDLLVDLATWLPHSAQTWAEADTGTEYVLLSEFLWATCGGASPSSTVPPP